MHFIVLKSSHHQLSIAANVTLSHCNCHFNVQFVCMWLRRGAIVTTFIVCYALTSFISGYVSGGMYSRNGGKRFDHKQPCFFFSLLFGS